MSVALRDPSLQGDNCPRFYLSFPNPIVVVVMEVGKSSTGAPEASAEIVSIFLNLQATSESRWAEAWRFGEAAVFCPDPVSLDEAGLRRPL